MRFDRRQKFPFKAGSEQIDFMPGCAHDGVGKKSEDMTRALIGLPSTQIPSQRRSLTCFPPASAYASTTIRSLPTPTTTSCASASTRMFAALASTVDDATSVFACPAPDDEF